MERKQNTIESEATDWVIRRDAGVSAEEQMAFDTWIAADRRHHGAFVRARAAWSHTDRVMALVDSQFLTAPVRRHSGRRFGRGFLLAASLTAIAVLSAGVWLTQFRGRQSYASDVGEVRKIELSDGSRLSLNTDTQATVRFQPTERAVELGRGEALFNVAHDPRRPFIVRANDVEIKAIGTAFTVRVDDTRTDVVVTEGTVEISHGNAPAQRVTANHRVILASSESRTDIEPVAPATIARDLAWRDGRVAFDGEPLSLATAEINRHSRHPIRVPDPTLAARPVIGIFQANDAEGFATAAAVTFGARVEHVGGEIRLVPAASP